MEHGIAFLLVIKSDRERRIPQLGQTVRIEGRSGLYRVLTEDIQRRVADLMENGNMHGIEKDVPFHAIRPVDEKVCKAIQEFLNS